MAMFDYGVVIIGSGLGGSVAALRAADRARSTAMSAATVQTAVLEQHEVPFRGASVLRSATGGAPSRWFIIERFGANVIDRLGPVAEYRRMSC
jgi:flavin-dependent dehydrogenase